MTAPTTVVDEETLKLEEPSIFTIGGRYFQARRQTTQRQDTYLALRIEASGLEQLKDQLGPDGDITDLAIGVLRRAYEQDLLYEIVGALLTELDGLGKPLPLVDGKGRPQKWTQEKAEEIGNFLANIDDPDEKELLNPIVNSVIILFFTTGVGSLKDSLSSSGTTLTPSMSEDNPISSEIPRPDGLSADGPSETLARVFAAGDLDPTITASGIRSSGQ